MFAQRFEMVEHDDEWYSGNNEGGSDECVCAVSSRSSNQLYQQTETV